MAIQLRLPRSANKAMRIPGDDALIGIKEQP
jgi:hypothetical protein